jgi:hypothetical protein
VEDVSPSEAIADASGTDDVTFVNGDDDETVDGDITTDASVDGEGGAGVEDVFSFKIDNVEAREFVFSAISMSVLGFDSPVIFIVSLLFESLILVLRCISSEIIVLSGSSFSVHKLF